MPFNSICCEIDFFEKGKILLKRSCFRSMHSGFILSHLKDNANVNLFQMGLGLVANTGNGIMGIGFRSGEATPNRYPTLVETMASQNIISTPAYSVWLTDYGESESPDGYQF
jgi:Eukaryotic aspartyl protease